MLLSIKNITLHFGKRPILNNVSLDVNEGEIIAITGKSGSGKTSILGIVSGLLDPDSGTVSYKGKNILKWGDIRRSRFRNSEIGFVFQFFNLLPDMTSYQNIRYPSLIKLFPGNVDRDIRSMAELLGIKEILNQKPQTLSGGERQRVAIARAIINKPRLILADEPTGNLDVLTAKEIKNLFTRLRSDENIAIILVTHDQTLIEIADAHYHLENGVLTRMDKPAVKEKSAKSTNTKSTKKIEKSAPSAPSKKTPVKRATVLKNTTAKKKSDAKKPSAAKGKKPGGKR